MEKIIILGRAGSGKSTFARELGNKTGLPVFHLDNIWWNSNRTHISKYEFDQQLNTLLSNDSWIIDGDYSRTYEVRISAADTVIFLDYPLEVCLEGVRTRIGTIRPDIPWIEHSEDKDLIDLMYQYDTVNKPILLTLFEKYNSNVITFHDRKETAEWLKNI